MKFFVKAFLLSLILTFVFSACEVDTFPVTSLTGKHWKLIGYGEYDNWSSPYPSLKTIQDYQAVNCMADNIRVTFVPGSNLWDLSNSCTANDSWSGTQTVMSMRSLYFFITPRRVAEDEELTYEVQNNGANLIISRKVWINQSQYLQSWAPLITVTYSPDGTTMLWTSSGPQGSQRVRWQLDTSIPAY